MPLDELRRGAAFGAGARLADRKREFSVASLTAADNLLTKAAAALDSGDPARAERMIDRAVALPFDEFEERIPALVAAGMMLFDLVTDILEGCEPGDSLWLDVALDVLHAPGPGRPHLAHVLAVIAHDYHVEPKEHRRLTAAITEVAPAPSPWDLRMPPEKTKEIVFAILQVTRAYEVALEQRQA